MRGAFEYDLCSDTNHVARSLEIRLLQTKKISVPGKKVCVCFTTKDLKRWSSVPTKTLKKTKNTSIVQ